MSNPHHARVKMQNFQKISARKDLNLKKICTPIFFFYLLIMCIQPKVMTLNYFKMCFYADDNDVFILRYVTGRRPAHAGKAI